MERTGILKKDEVSAFTETRNNSTIRTMRGKRWGNGASIAACGIAAMLLACSLLWYRTVVYPAYVPAWQVHMFDHADYRFLAEYFWNIPHEPQTYIAEFGGSWGAYLQMIPFRGIGVGTVYLFMLRPLEHIVHPSGMLAAFMGIAYIIACGTVWQRFGRLAAIACFTAFLFPAKTWALSSELLAEPLLRTLMVLLWAIYVWIDGKNERIAQAVPLIWLLTFAITCTKSMWFLLPITLGITMLVLPSSGTEARKSRMATGALFLVPVTLFMIHGIGWGYWGITAGNGLHANYKTSGAYLAEFCITHKGTELCNTQHPINQYWQVPMNEGIPQAEWREFDRRATSYLLSRNALGEFLNGIAQQTNFPAGITGNTPFSRSNIALVLDLASWLLLIIGLGYRRTALLAALTLSMWIIPGIGTIFAAYTARYARATAGLPLATALLIGTIIARENWRKLAHMQRKKTRIIATSTVAPSPAGASPVRR